MKRILIVEDDESIAELERDYLQASGFETKLCFNGREGMQEALSGTYDLMILDLMLPGESGFEICREVRERFNTPILIVSAKRDDIDKVQGLGLGADDYITKPFSPRELVARVRAHLSRYERLVSAKQGDVLVIRGLKIDRSAHRVFVNGEERTLTAKEFDLLNFLASNPNRVFREIWGEESIGEIATITVHIKKIREKIEVDSAKPQYIETIWGVGYRFRV